METCSRGKEGEALGVQYDLREIWEGSFQVQNKPGRIEKILQLTEQFRDEGKDKSLAATLAGLLNFAGGFVLGYALKPVTHSLAKWMSPYGGAPVSKNEICDMIQVLVRSLKPRRVSRFHIDAPFIIYTDGAFENGVATWGALVIDTHSGERVVHAGTVPVRLVDYWVKTVGEQVICQVETYAFLCVRWLWRKSLNNRCGIVFIDNEASRLSLIKRGSPSISMFLLIAVGSLLDSVGIFAPWYERVPSYSNPADLPSRGQSELLCQMFNARNCGEICLPAFVLSFLMQKRFDVELAELIKFEADDVG